MSINILNAAILQIIKHSCKCFCESRHSLMYIDFICVCAWMHLDPISNVSII